MSRQTVIALVITLLAVVGMGVWSFRVGREGTTASLWFEALGPEASPEFTQREGSPLTPEEVARIQAIAQRELHAAYASTCVKLSESPDARYRLRVQPGTLGLAAAGSRSLPGVRGDGAISFASIAASAVAFAPVEADRETVVEAIGRGIGRTAAHELAHQLLGSFQLHDKNDRLSYEFPDVRPEHFYSTLHWSLAAAPLQARYGRNGHACS